MFLVPFLRLALLLLFPISFISSVYLYFYPVFHSCAFPTTEKSPNHEYLATFRNHLPFPTSSDTVNNIAPFRLLVLADPQIEGDSSIDHVEATNFPSYQKLRYHLHERKVTHRLQTLRNCLHSLVDLYLDDVPKALLVWWKRLDHIGNDYFLGHIYRTLHWWTNPTHVTVLGDLIGSQWIDDNEFELRGGRYWNRIFKGGIKVEDELAQPNPEDFRHKLVLGEDDGIWSKRIINVAGNHDIGYAGDMSPSRILRFTRVFGKPHYELRFEMPIRKNKALAWNYTNYIPELRIVVLNNLNLDVPAGSKELQDETYKFLNSIITTSPSVDRLAHFTLLLTHIPLYKQEGICADGPYFKYFEDKYENGVKEQYLLSQHASNGILEGIFGMSGRSDVPGGGFGRGGVILNGHDHEGCDVLHFINQSLPHEPQWEATPWVSTLSSSILGNSSSKIPSLREITLRSMMGAYDGNAGLFSLWFDEKVWDWKFNFVNCRLGKQHIWWVIHILDLTTFLLLILYWVMNVASRFTRSRKENPIKNSSKPAAHVTSKDSSPKTDYIIT
ncbi:Protein TED1 [Erysiphe neolycopersici]|uniref:Protein TED1 n=1 Tax=Erysiphe neolycopersici TaxID=212602 RepID=A0A420HGU2_9PEZI|nr:Protein TED1 [Erysiphe neolycopersici]